MDFSKLSEETMALSAQMGPRQQKLLFDQEFYEDELTLREGELEDLHEISDKETEQAGPGIIFFVDIGSGSFCVRGLPVVENNLSLEDLTSLNHHFEKTKKVHFFPCESIEVAEMISEQMINRRYPLQDNGLVNISDPGSTWLMKYDDKQFSLFFKTMNFGDKDLENIGAIGDPQIFKFWWSKMANELNSSLHVEFQEDEKGCHLRLLERSGEVEEDFFQKLLHVLLLGEIPRIDHFIQNKFESENIKNFLNELSHSRRFWLKVEELLVN